MTATDPDPALPGAPHAALDLGQVRSGALYACDGCGRGWTA